MLKSLHPFAKQFETTLQPSQLNITLFISVQRLKNKKINWVSYRKLNTKVWIAKRAKCSHNSPAFQFWRSTWVLRCQQNLCSSWVTEPSWYWNMMTVKASLTPANGVINNKTRWARKGGWRVIWAQHMHFPAGRRGRQGRRDARYGVTLPESVIWHLLCVCESVRGQEKVFKGTAASS